MAVVNVDITEYDAIRNRNKELEEQVKELKKLNETLKNGAKVILRKETVVQTKDRIEKFDPFYEGDGRLIDTQPRFKRTTTESSESYVNFEDVRLKVENEMRKEVEQCIKNHNDAYDRYVKKYNSLESDYQKKQSELEVKRKELEESCKKKLQEENNKLRNEYKESFEKNEDRIRRLHGYLDSIYKLARKANADLNHRFFSSKKAIELIDEIIHLTIVPEGLRNI